MFKSAYFLFLLGAIQISAFDCSKVQLGDKTIDLSTLNNEFSVKHNETVPPTINNYLYRVNMCKPLTAPEAVPKEDSCGANSWGCKVVTNYKSNAARVIEVLSFAEGENNGYPEFSVVQPEGKPKGVFWEMTGQTINEIKWKTKIEVLCHTEEAIKIELVSANQGEINFKVHNKAICEQVLVFNNGYLYLFLNIPEDKKPEDKKPDDKKPEDKKPDDKKPDDSNKQLGFFSFFFYL
ncbi:hypothetical protein BB561_002306 [Smittium simulii]|uniref:Uncharacterized protein n=1 Tax=Smittium simulii TaxID=133385 RepID=A0A2T9YQZ9_9FUNG|nr:hypothetical protein BB561_002306 [Smittium simulii]